MPPSAPPVIFYASLGGTITMTGVDGVAPALTAEDVIAAASGIEKIAALRAMTIVTIPGASLTFEHLEQVLAAAEGAVDEGAVGVVVSQGTDTIEETSYYLDLRWGRTAPLVMTGAMRTPQSLSADGPSNLHAAVTVAVSSEADGLGVVVVLDEAVHAAARVRKDHSTALAAFCSSPGPLGWVVEGVFESVGGVPRPPALDAPCRSDVRVAALATGIDDDGSLLRAAVDAGVEGVVIDAFGAGHLPYRLAEVVAQIAESIPIVVSSRTGSGRTLRSTYGFSGSEKDLAARGAILSGWLDARKSRVLLRALLATDTPIEGIRAGFDMRGRLAPPN